MDVFFLSNDGTHQSIAPSTQAAQTTTECAQAPERHISEEESIAWWFAIILLLGVTIVAVVGGLIIKHRTDDSIRYK